MALEAMPNAVVSLLVLDQGLQDPRQAGAMLLSAVVTEKHVEALRIIASCAQVFPDVMESWKQVTVREQPVLVRSLQALAGSPLYAYPRTREWSPAARVMLEQVARYALGNYVEESGLEAVLERLERRRENIYITSRTRALDLLAMIVDPNDQGCAEEITRALLGCPHESMLSQVVGQLSTTALKYILAIVL